MQISEIKVTYSQPDREKTIIKSSNDAYSIALAYWDINCIEFNEEVKILLLDRANAVLGYYNVSKGGTSGSYVDIKIILSVALKTQASSIMLIHNHPSGKLKPSEADINLTSKLKKACNMIDMVLLDHLIISKDSYFSFSDEGVL